MDLFGTLIAATVLAVATVFGLWRRRADGRLRTVASSVGGGDLPAGRARAAAGAVDSADAIRARRIDPTMLRALGIPPDTVTLLQFSSAFCAPCRAVRQVCSEVVGLLPQVRHVEVDAESHLDVVRALDIWRTPTVFVLDQAGVVVSRATGVPTKAQVIAVLGVVLSGD